MLFLEQLESRRLLSAAVHGLVDHPHGPPANPGAQGKGHGHHGPPPAVVVHGRNLMIKGTKDSDTLVITVDPSDPNSLDVTFNGDLTVVPIGRIKHIKFNGKRGDDSVTIDPSVHINAHLVGGPGNDNLAGGSGNDHLIAGSGENQLSGGAGADVFVARSAGEVTDFNSGDGDSIIQDQADATDNAAPDA